MCLCSSSSAYSPAIKFHPISTCTSTDWGWIMVWVGVSFFFSFFLFGTRRSDVLFVTVPCFHLNADWLGSQLKHIPCSRTTLDIPMGFFFSSGFFCFLCRVLHRHPAFKAKNKHREFTWGGKDWGFTISYQSKILTNNPMTYVGHSQKTRWPESPARGFEWNQGMKRRRSVCERYTVKSSLCQINQVIKCRKKKTI